MYGLWNFYWSWVLKEATEEDIEDAKVEALNALFKNIDMEMTEAEKASYVQLNLARHYINLALSILGLLVYSVLIHGVRTENPRSVNKPSRSFTVSGEGLHAFRIFVNQTAHQFSMDLAVKLPNFTSTYHV